MCSAHTAHMAFVAIMLWPTRPTNSLAIQDVCIIWPPECEIWNKCIYWVFVITILVLFVCVVCIDDTILQFIDRSANKKLFKFYFSDPIPGFNLLFNHFYFRSEARIENKNVSNETKCNYLQRKNTFSFKQRTNNFAVLSWMYDVCSRQRA